MPAKTRQIKKQVEKQTLAMVFLKLLVRSLVVNSYVPGKEPEEKEFEDVEREFVGGKKQMVVEISPATRQKIKAFEKTGLSGRPGTLEIAERKLAPPMQRRVRIVSPGGKPTLQPQRFQGLPQPPPFVPSQKQQVQKINLGKLAQVLMDPAVFSVESPGPGKNILVNRSGQIQTSAIILTKEEIDEIIKTISDATRIPVVPGVFKASLQDLIVTAVISEYVGTRFIIQKKMPGRMM